MAESEGCFDETVHRASSRARGGGLSLVCRCLQKPINSPNTTYYLISYRIALGLSNPENINGELARVEAIVNSNIIGVAKLAGLEIKTDELQAQWRLTASYLDRAHKNSQKSTGVC
ncbi:unnamed protein product [Phytophthora lilii]|uniref:Unnamed protein product n=1 Tax=Phytophthora lilii TaxID=2077276 RepID=A0A9W6TWP2_9STRA|nr:unnamed protein product [Phytophthora lilii]